VWETACGPGDPCKVSSFKKETVTANATYSDGYILMALGVETLDCGDSFLHTPEVLSLDAIGGASASAKTVVIVVDKSEVRLDADNGASKYQVCYSNDTGFTDRDGNWVAAGGSGLLPDCSPPADTADAPCVSSKMKSKGQVIITLFLPAGDPRIN
jgi:hypothetical protein